MEDWSQIFLRLNRLFVVLCQKLGSGGKNIAVCHRVCWEGNLWWYQPEQEAVANSLIGIRKENVSITQGTVWPGGAESTDSNYLAGLCNIGQTFKGPKLHYVLYYGVMVSPLTRFSCSKQHYGIGKLDLLLWKKIKVSEPVLCIGKFCRHYTFGRFRTKMKNASFWQYFQYSGKILSVPSFYSETRYKQTH